MPFLWAEAYTAIILSRVSAMIILFEIVHVTFHAEICGKFAGYVGLGCFFVVEAPSLRVCCTSLKSFGSRGKIIRFEGSKMSL